MHIKSLFKIIVVIFCKYSLKDKNTSILFDYIPSFIDILSDLTNKANLARAICPNTSATSSWLKACIPHSPLSPHSCQSRG